MMHGMERRQFIKLTGAGVAAGAAAMLVGCGIGQPKSSTSGDSSNRLVGWTNVDFSYDVDVCILGAGAAGLSCAYETAKAGLNTLVIEKQVTYGGDAATSANTWMASYSDICKEQRPDQYVSIEQVHAAYDKNYGDDPDYCQLSKNWITYAAAWHKLITKDLGVKWQEAVPCAYDGMYWPEGGIGQGKELWDRVYKATQDAGAKYLYSTRADSFIVDSENKVVGLRCWDDANGANVDVKAGAFALCTGGFASNQSMVAQYYPDMLNKGCITTASMGEGIKLGQSIGAGLSHMGGSVNYNPHSECIHVSQAIGRSFSILNNGKRFYSETAIHNGPEYCLKTGEFSWWVIWDKQITEGPSAKKVASSQDIRVSGNTVEELSNAMGMPTAVLQGAFDRWDAICDAGADPEFGRTLFLEKLEPPYYAVQLYPVRYKTSGGLLTTPDGEVLTESKEVIAGMYAAGQTGGTSDIMPAVGSGMMIGEKIGNYLKK